jgi:hypothetical protein
LVRSASASKTEASDSNENVAAAAFVIFNVVAVKDPEKMAAYRERAGDD